MFKIVLILFAIWYLAIHSHPVNETEKSEAANNDSKQLLLGIEINPYNLSTKNENETETITTIIPDISNTTNANGTAWNDDDYYDDEDDEDNRISPNAIASILG